ncbi:MAG: hypothetical protein JWN34_4909 [Bryobacterales bacterium]|jgi:hypothetical protein|nr:hypothetical protein [Bryobacterales bacterium]
MKRRSYLKAMLAASAALPVVAQKKGAANPIVLYVDMQVAPGKEKDLVRLFHEDFLPTAKKHEGFIDLKIVKLRQEVQGKAPAGMNYRFQLTCSSEESRQKWIKSADHARVWPPIEATMVDTKNYTVLLCDAI